MRVALISDIHGHAMALEAVLADIRRQQIDAIVCLGDVATVGPQPREVLSTLKQLGAMCVMGNHDATLLDLSKMDEYHIASALSDSMEWCSRQLSTDDFEYLRSFAPTLEIRLDERTTMFCYHGSPRSKTDILLATTSPEAMEQHFAGYDAAILVGGHSHIQMSRRFKRQLIVNPGSVGNAFVLPYTPNIRPLLLPWAEYGIVESVDGTLGINLRRVRFDIPAFLQTVSKSEMPNKSWWYEQYAEHSAP